MDAKELASFEKFNYFLRPSKQVERKLFIEALHRLGAAGYNMRDYTYLGFGSVYYVDFVLFHKYLYIDKMICIEAARIPARMRFNKPYDFIRLEMKEVADVLPALDRKERYLVWLDYDYVLNGSILADLGSLLHILSRGSIFVVTVEAEPRLPDRRADARLGEEERLKRVKELFERDLGRYYDEDLNVGLLARNKLPSFFAQVLRAFIDEEVRQRQEEVFVPLFNCVYADRAQMLTVGGVIDDLEARGRIERSGIYDFPFVHRETDPVKIAVPHLTVREKLWLEQRAMDGADVGELEVEIGEHEVGNFRRFYRYYPTYHEVLV